MNLLHVHINNVFSKTNKKKELVGHVALFQSTENFLMFGLIEDQ